MEHLHSERRWCDFEALFRSSRRHLAPHHMSGRAEQQRSAASIWPSVETGACLGVVNGCRRRLFSLKKIEARDSSLQVGPGVALRICHFNRFFITYQHRAEERRSLGKSIHLAFLQEDWTEQKSEGRWGRLHLAFLEEQIWRPQEEFEQICATFYNTWTQDGRIRNSSKQHT